jgi:alanine-synthesizing transaminase
LTLPGASIKNHWKSMEFSRIKRLPPYVLAEVVELKHRARVAGEDIIDLGMGNPDGATPPHIVQSSSRPRARPQPSVFLLERSCRSYAWRWPIGTGGGSGSSSIRHRNRGDDRRQGRPLGGTGALGPGDMVVCPSPAYAIHPYWRSSPAPACARRRCFARVEELLSSREHGAECWPKPKLLTLVPEQSNHGDRRCAVLQSASSNSRARSACWSSTTSPTRT